MEYVDNVVHAPVGLFGIAGRNEKKKITVEGAGIPARITASSRN